MQAQIRIGTIEKLKVVFSPEMLNRIDEIIVFHALMLEHLYAIADLMVTQTQQRLAQQAITLQITEEARCWLAEQKYNPASGARHLRKTVQCFLEDMLAEAILRGVFKRGDTVLVEVVAGNLSPRILTSVPAKEI